MPKRNIMPCDIKRESRLIMFTGDMYIAYCYVAYL